MKRGTTTINLTFEIEFADDGNDAKVLSIRSDGHLVDVASEPFLTDALPEPLWEQIKADAWEDATDAGPNHEAEESEFCGRVG